MMNDGMEWLGISRCTLEDAMASIAGVYEIINGREKSVNASTYTCLKGAIVPKERLQLLTSLVILSSAISSISTLRIPLYAGSCNIITAQDIGYAVQRDQQGS